VTGTSAPFDSEAGFRAAIALTLAGAQRELRIFDRNLALMGLDERAQAELLDRFLAAGRDRRLQIIVHDLTPLQSRLPRLLKLMRDYAQQLDVRVTPEHLRHLAECWLLADGSSGTIRFHGDHARGKVVAAIPTEIKRWWQRADDLAAESEACAPWAVAGL
jgi:integrase